MGCAQSTSTFTPTDLPTGDSVWFHGLESDYPSIEEIRQNAEDIFGAAAQAYRPKPVRFPGRKLIVKWGTFVGIAEGQCIWFLQNHLAHLVPVPKIYGWKRDGEQTFLFLELVDGSPLDERWPRLKPGERRAACRELRHATQALKRVRTPHDYPSLCSISGGALRDITFLDGDIDTTGPHDNAADFHDALAKLALPPSETFTNPRKEVDELSGFDDRIPIKFTHADLDKSNIILSREGDGPCRLLAIIDWHQAGWYPEPWEYLKAQSLDDYDSEWVRIYLAKFLKKPKFQYLRSYEFVRMSTI
ncbi:uncharacterized protein K489DRAFT_316862 [Dissoconium aciculare CBS 342.82]|uniref:Aminoglycoside phosphotransferase domain-containing protein n=1 Tax=Dissoconium aciculare CBS 342.82 TaxID=1314786 RepID=A0A6J3MD36_9PEZI|nr:uncharacterized protein K489DRAFT_316862 [Dissoconium aciculare CBS 342.82]KAF1824757.1 hypothetical protein K489DRAFT_316862 [Dissoconium aciculare CBS 342.82]